MLTLKILQDALDSLCTDPSQIRITGELYDLVLAHVEESCKAKTDVEKTNEHPEPNECPMKEE